MKILVWNAPWAVQGDLHFFRNCYLKHLLLQANLLAKQKIDVDLVINDYIDDPAAEIDASINTIKLSANEIFSLTQNISNPLVRLYKNSDRAFLDKIKTLLTPRLAKDYDAILLWENPVPFLEEMFPNTLIVHQMPGAFSRAPFPATTVFDVEGLYREGALHKFSSDIIALDTPGESSILGDYRSTIHEMYHKLPSIFKKETSRDGFDSLALLPLQVSSHYAFQADTPYSSQMDYLLDVLVHTPKKTGVITTQYVSPKISDTILTPESYKSLKPHWENLIYSTEFDKIPNISQHLLPQVDSVITSSSSVGIQAMLWSKKVEVYGNTFLSNFSDQQLISSNANVQQAQNNVLDFILTKHQVLTTKIVHEGEFLVNLIEELIQNKKNQKSSLDSFVNFSSIDPDYENKLISSINFSKVTKAIRATSPMLDAEIITIEKFERSIRNNKISSISFDVFDTLIARPVEVPSDAYQLLEMEALKISKGCTEDFARVRLTAEVETRAHSTEGEITLDQIYTHIKHHYQLNDDLLTKIKQCEIDLEVSLIQRRNIGYKLWNIAKASKKPITIISDMYLPSDVVLRMLEKTGYSGYEKLYVSSDYGARKKEGQLFDIVIQDQNIITSTHLHIGDNRLADGEMAQARGMHAFRIPRAIDRMRSNPHFAKIFNPRLGVGERSRSVISGLIANELFDMPSGDLEQSTLFMGSPFRLGYAAIGPLLSAYMLWLTRRAKAEGVSRLYFLSREGWILKEVYDQLNKSNPTAVPSTYLYCSRRAARVAAISNVSDITAVASQPFEGGVRLSNLLSQRFGLSISPEIETYIANSVFASSEALLASDSQGRVAFSQLCVALSDFILSQSAVERDTYLQYLNESGLVSESNPAIVDIGWKGNMQGSLGALVNRSLKGAAAKTECNT